MTLCHDWRIILPAIFLTASNTAIIGPIARGLGWVMDKLYYLIYSLLGIHGGAIAIAIMLFTIVIYMALLPLTFKQQKFAMLQRKMQPEMKAIQDKYKNKRDTASMQAMQEETQALYDKYGVSPMGSCIQLVIQLPILYALYGVFNNIPAYLSSVKSIFTNVATGIFKTSGFESVMSKLVITAHLSNIDFKAGDSAAIKNHIIDVLYKLPNSGWNTLQNDFPKLSSQIETAHRQLSQVNYFGVLNISDTPWSQMMSGIHGAGAGLFIAALLIPIVAYLSQYFNMKLTPQSDNGNDAAARQMKTMNFMMPLITFFISFTTPVGLSLYWIAGAVIRSIQQIVLNKHFEKIDLNDIIEKNKEKAAKKAEKRGIKRANMYQYGNMSTRNLSRSANISQDKADQLNKAREASSKARKGSMTSKANLVKDFNERNTKK